METNTKTQQAQLFGILNNSYIFVEYVKTVVKSVTSNFCKDTKTYLNNIRKSLNFDSKKHGLLIKIGKYIKKVHLKLRDSELHGTPNPFLRSELRKLNKLRREVRTSQPHNIYMSLV